MNRDPNVALVSLVLMLVGGSIAVIVAALREDRRARERSGEAAGPDED